MLAVTANNVRSRHWTIYGGKYTSWHVLLGEIYDYLNEATDKVAENVVQSGGLPARSMADFIDGAMDNDTQESTLVVDWKYMVRYTAMELRRIIDYINDNASAFDECTLNDLTGIGSKLKHYEMFCNQTLKEAPM